MANACALAARQAVVQVPLAPSAVLPSAVEQAVSRGQAHAEEAAVQRKWKAGFVLAQVPADARLHEVQEAARFEAIAVALPMETLALPAEATAAVDVRQAEVDGLSGSEAGASDFVEEPVQALQVAELAQALQVAVLAPSRPIVVPVQMQPMPLALRLPRLLPR